ncbi:MAG: hypothetical protein IJE40_00095, partial [Clostridia bacterium]|nr:hypothetical protein [Clostridia bacterium]
RYDFFELLKKYGIKAVSESDVPEGCGRLNSEESETDVPQSDESNVGRKEISESKRNEVYYEKLSECMQKIKNDPQLERQYEEELTVLKKGIAQLCADGYSSAVKVIVTAMLNISRYRVREKLKNGWVCGTHVSALKSYSEKTVRFLFSEEELEALISCCVKGETLSDQQYEILIMLLHYAPHMHINMRNLYE